MIYTTCYDSPLGKLTLAGKNNKLIGLWIEGQKHFFGNFKDGFCDSALINALRASIR